MSETVHKIGEVLRIGGREKHQNEERKGEEGQGEHKKGFMNKIIDKIHEHHGRRRRITGLAAMMSTITRNIVRTSMGRRSRAKVTAGVP